MGRAFTAAFVLWAIIFTCQLPGAAPGKTSKVTAPRSPAAEKQANYRSRVKVVGGPLRPAGASKPRNTGPATPPKLRSGRTPQKTRRFILEDECAPDDEMNEPSPDAADGSEDAAGGSEEGGADDHESHDGDGEGGAYSGRAADSQLGLEEAPPPLPKKGKRKGVKEGKGKVKPKTSKLATRVMEISVTIGRHNVDVTQADVDGVTAYLKDSPDCKAFAVAVERGGTAFLKHMQCVVQFNTTSPAMFRNDLQRVLMWKKEDRVRVSCKELSGEGMHTWCGMLGYISKDEGQAHFVLYTKNVEKAELLDGAEVYARLGAINKNVVPSNPANILDKAFMFWRFQLKCPARLTFLGTVSRMMATQKYVLAASWAAAGKGVAGLDRVKSEMLWKSYTGEVLDSVDLAALVYSEEGRRQYGEDMRMVRRCVQDTTRELMDEPGGPARDMLLAEYRDVLKTDGFVHLDQGTFLYDFVMWVQKRKAVAEAVAEAAKAAEAAT